MNLSRFIFILAVVSLTACSSQKKSVYFQGEAREEARKYPEFILRISPNDILSIQVFTINTEAFPGIASTIDKAVIDNRTAYEKGFMLDRTGTVELPLIGKVNLSGLSIPEARDTLAERFKFFMDDPIVMIKKLSFKVSILLMY